MSTNPAVPKEVPPDVDRSSTSTIRDEAFNPVANHEKLKNDPVGMDKNLRKQETQITHVEGQTRPRQRRGDTGDGRHILQEEEAPEVLGFAWSTRKKWTTLTVIFIVQCSMNYNAAVYANGTAFLQEKFDISAQAARVGQMIFLVSYAFGCEAWAPWSEELGRRWILQSSLFLVNIWQILAALAPNFGSVIVARFLGGISSAGGSVTLGMVADLYDPNEQQWAVAFIVFSSVGGSVIGPIVGPFIAAHLDWGWICWTQLIFGGFVQILHLLIVPESRATILLDREAKRRREAGEHNIYGPNELKSFKERFSLHEMVKTFCRPFIMFVTEPIVLCLSLLSGFSDALIFTFMEAFTPVYEQWGFDTEHMALAFVPIAIGYFLAYLIYIPPLMKQRKVLRKDPDAAPELRLQPLLYLAPLETIGLFGFAWTSLGPPHVHWIAPMIFSCLVGIANYAIYMSTIDYMVAAYGPYSASATGGNGMARDFLAGIAALYATPFYTNIGGSSYRLHLEWPSTILAIIAFFVAIPIYVFYYYGAWFRERSKFAMSLAGERIERRVSRLEEQKMPA
ncbi:multidrug transporter [Cryptococcus deuterogattii 99/473]|uniref:Unplaced genomic scaffold supercont1.11, whole genome shotgun sequence n=1 Tax=Cryptococcus deuterogattii Ram5 TaxID=1296110 RepID=A0A0D0UZK1_9TREE|nr:multidrug transporter [Cryptococcus deuterogattii Ram5]KIR99275.1 multidrug transporter [Cryptococcus deuterogattii 2001/935-1]KIY59264.1 multidrug transporter [Cryptococcus deuterogattii 99/473]